MIAARVTAGLVAGLALLACRPLAAADNSEHGSPESGAHAAEPVAEMTAEDFEKLEHEPAEDDGHAGSGDGHGDGHGSGNTDPLELKKDLALWTFVVFLVLLAVLWKFAWGPIAEGLNRREQGIADQIAQAELSNQQARQLLAGYEEKLAGAKADVRELLEKGRQDAELLGREMLDKAKQEAEAEQQRALQQIDTATTVALKELADRSATLAVELAGKIVDAKLDGADHARLIRQAVNGFANRTTGTQ